MSNRKSGDIEKAVRGSLANYFSAILQLGGFAFHVIGARVFGKYAYGGYVFAWGVIEIAAKVGLLGLDKGIMRSVATERARKDTKAEFSAVVTALRSAILASICVILIIIFLAGSIASWKGDAVFAPVLRVMAFIVLTWACMMILVYATMATGTMRYNLLIRGVAEPILLLLSLAFFILFWREGGGMAIGLAHLTASGMALFVAFVFFGRLFPLGRLRRQIRSLKSDWSLLRFSLPVAFAELLNQAIYRTDLIVIGVFFKDPLLVANYGACIQLSSAISSIRYAFDPIISPVVAEINISGDKARLKRNLQMMSRWVTMLVLPMFLAMVVFGDILLSMWGKSYADVYLTLVILASAHLINAIFGLHQWPVVMSGRSKLDLVNNAAAFSVNLALNLIMIPIWGLPGAAMATLVGNVVFRGLQAFQVWAIFHVHVFSIYWFKLLAAAAAAAVAETAVRWIFPANDITAFLMATGTGIACYLLFAVRLGLAEEDRSMMTAIRAGHLDSIFQSKLS